MSRFRLFLFVNIALLFTACFHDDKGSTGVVEPKINLSQLSVVPASFSVTEPGVDVQLNYQALDDDDLDVSEAIQIDWQSSDENIATVSDSGLVTTLAEGAVTITASYNNLSQESDVSVGGAVVGISGIARYEDRLYDKTSFTGKALKAIRHASVDLLAADGTILESTSTSSTGNYFFTIVPNQFDIRLIAMVESAPAENFMVKDLDGDIYSVLISSEPDKTSYPITLESSSSATLPGAFNLLDISVSSAEFAKGALSIDAKDLSIYWQPASFFGTYYCDSFFINGCDRGKGIYVLNLRGVPGFQPPYDTDEFDDDVFFHEFGHYLAQEYSIDDSNGGCHLPDQNDRDLRLSWSEGWGGFISTAIKSWMKTNSPVGVSSQAPVTAYVDTEDNVAISVIDVDDFGSFDTTYRFASSEVAVNKMLWEMHEINSVGMFKIWDVMGSYFTNFNGITNFASFWDGLLGSQLYDAGSHSELLAAINDRDVYYQEDNYEPDNSIAEASLQSVSTTGFTTHYIYRDDEATDEDYVAFVAQAGSTYEIQTSGLRNGIDTFIRIYDPNGLVLTQNGEAVENDDADPGAYLKFDSDCVETRVFNDATSLASSVKFTASEDATYFILVRHIEKFSFVERFTGHYGSYRLSIKKL